MQISVCQVACVRGGGSCNHVLQVGVQAAVVQQLGQNQIPCLHDLLVRHSAAFYMVWRGCAVQLGERHFVPARSGLSRRRA